MKQIFHVPKKGFILFLTSFLLNSTDIFQVMLQFNIFFVSSILRHSLKDCGEVCWSRCLKFSLQFSGLVASSFLPLTLLWKLTFSTFTCLWVVWNVYDQILICWNCRKTTSMLHMYFLLFSSTIINTKSIAICSFVLWIHRSFPWFIIPSSNTQHFNWH